MKQEKNTTYKSFFKKNFLSLFCAAMITPTIYSNVLAEEKVDEVKQVELKSLEDNTSTKKDNKEALSDIKVIPVEKKEISNTIETNKDVDLEKVSNLEKNKEKLSKEKKQATAFVFSEEPVENFYNYDEYVEYRDKTDPKRENNSVMLQGGVINSPDFKLSSDEVEILKYDINNLIKKAKDPIENQNQNEVLKDLYKYKLIENLLPMMGFSLFDELKPLDKTIFVFMDPLYQKEKSNDFIIPLIQEAELNNYNIIFYPIAIVDKESEREAFNLLKAFIIGDPSDVLKLNEESFLSTYRKVRLNKFLAQRFQDGVVTNNINYVKNLQLVDPVMIMKFNNKTNQKDYKPYLSESGWLNKEGIKKFINQ